MVKEVDFFWQITRGVICVFLRRPGWPKGGSRRVDSFLDSFWHLVVGECPARVLAWKLAIEHAVGFFKWLGLLFENCIVDASIPCPGG